MRLFFYKQGFLKNLKSIINLEKNKIFFCFDSTKIKCSTKEIYSKVKKFSKKKVFKKKQIKKKINFLNYLLKAEMIYNLLLKKNIL